MAFFQSLLTTDTFANWYTKFNNVAVKISAQREHIKNYIIDDTTPPTIETIGGRIAASFPASSTSIIYFDFPALNFKDLSEDRHIRLTYAMETSEAADVVLSADFNLFSNDTVVSVSSPTETDTNTITVNTTALKLDYDESLTLSAANLTASTDFIRVKLSRLGANGSDTHTGKFHLFDIEII